MNQPIDYHAILPELILAGTIMVVLVADAFLSLRRKWLTMWPRVAAHRPSQLRVTSRSSIARTSRSPARKVATASAGVQTIGSS